MGEAAVFFVGGEIAQAEGGGVGGIALIDLLEGEILGLDLVIAGIHGPAVVGIEDDYRAAFVDAEAELFGGGFVIGESEAVADASAVEGMIDERGAPIGRGRDGLQDARAEGQGAGEFFGVGFEAADEGSVLIEEDEEEECAGGKSGEMPFSQGKRAEEAERVDGGDEGKSGDEETDPAGGVIELEIFGEERGDAEGDETEFEKEQAVFPPGGGAWGAAEVQSGH